jgi:hypothetical protein
MSSMPAKSAGLLVSRTAAKLRAGLSGRPGRRLVAYGPNELSSRRRRQWRRELAARFTHPLAVAAVLAGWVPSAHEARDLGVQRHHPASVARPGSWSPAPAGLSDKLCRASIHSNAR